MTRFRCEVRVDRRTDSLEDVRDELASLVETVQGLDVVWRTDDEVANAADAARFRDFAPVAFVTHEREEALAWVVEELVESFGWVVDVSDMEELK